MDNYSNYKTYDSDESLTESGVMSSCCSAGVYAEIGVCRGCEEPCDEIKVEDEDEQEENS